MEALKKYFTSPGIFIVLIILIIISLIPILPMYGKINIGHDTFIPLVPENSYKMSYQWLDRDNGVYFFNNYFVWISFFTVSKIVNLTIYQAAFVFQFLIFLLSGLGIYRIFNLFNKKSPLWGLIPAVFFIYSPHNLDHLLYYQSIVGIIWFIYFLLKFILTRKLTFFDCVWISLSLGVMTDLPNPKYHFLLFLFFTVSIFFALILRLISFRNLFANLKYFRNFYQLKRAALLF